MANPEIIEIIFDYKGSLAKFKKETNSVFDGISKKAGKQKLMIQLDARDDNIIDKIKELQKLKSNAFTFTFGDLGVKEQIKTFAQLENRINGIIALSKNAGSTVSAAVDAGDSITLIDRLQSKLGVLNKFEGLASHFGFKDISQYVRDAVHTVRELDTALAEMRKVSNESAQALRKYQKESFSIADSVGTTALALQDATATWMSFGESLEKAKLSARDAAILLNISGFESMDKAAEALTAMNQAYGELEKIDIIDTLNNISSRYSISIHSLAAALQESAGALKTANNDFNEAAALTAAGNAIVQEPDAAGAGLRTIALRLAGTEAAKAELETLGEEADNVITMISKLRDTILSATSAAAADGKGFDILDANGNHKSTYEIMQGLAELYDEIAAKDKELGTNNLGLLLETIAGKKYSSIAASILQNGELLRSVYEDAQNSDGSAQKELDAYMESLDAKVAQFQNKLQELEYDLISSDLLKWFVDFGTVVVSALDAVIHKFGGLPAAISVGLSFKNIGKRRMSVRISYNYC